VAERREEEETAVGGSVAPGSTPQTEGVFHGLHSQRTLREEVACLLALRTRLLLAAEAVRAVDVETEETAREGEESEEWTVGERVAEGVAARAERVVGEVEVAESGESEEVGIGVGEGVLGVERVGVCRVRGVVAGSRGVVAIGVRGWLWKVVDCLCLSLLRVLCVRDTGASMDGWLNVM